MEWWLVLIIGIGALLMLFMSGVPIAFCFLGLDIIGLYFLFGERGMKLLANSMIDSVASFNMAPLPLFIFLGEIFSKSQAVDMAFDAIDKWIGGLRARLHIVALVFAGIYSAISGSGMAMAAVMGSGIYPEMVRRGYDKKLSLGVIMGGAVLDPLIPPSAAAVLVASLANISIAQLLISGLGPGLMYLGMFVVYILIRVWIQPALAPVYPSSSTTREKLMSIFKMIPFGFIIFLVLGLMMIGIATPTESAAVGAIAGLIFAAFLQKLTLRMLRDALLTTVNVTAMILFVIAGSKAFSQILAISGAMQGIVDTVAGLSISPFILLIVMQGIPFILGFFLDNISIMMMTIPFYVPLVEVAKFDPIWFWCLYLVNMTIGLISPPFGLVLFTLKAAVPSASLKDMYDASLPFVLMVLLGMIFMIMFPQVATVVPRLFSHS
jgi:tripartite ATP-independent transporter DctM subunit